LQCLADPRVPPGVINSVVESTSVVSQALCAHPDVEVLSFTG
jgi:acyl-CoA reductase-like NAD-dependent aldehyde dehydrogenase